MSRKKLLPALVTSALLVAAAASAFERNPGGETDAFGRWGLGARAEALGRAYAALADDASAAYWNPAGLAFMERTELAFAYGLPFAEVDDLNVGNVVLAKPLLYSMGEGAGGVDSLGTLAAALGYRRAGGIPEANENGPTGRTFADTDVELYLAYAHTLGEAGAFGLTLKSITRDVGDYSDSGFGIDAGLSYEALAGLRLGAVLRNIIAPNYRLHAIKDAPPLTAELGASYDVFGYVAPTAEFEITREGFYDVGAGLEVTPVPYVALRAGYYTADERLRAGLGFYLGDFAFDYALRFGGPLGDCHLASVSFLLGGPPESSEFIIPEEEYIEYEEEEEEETPGEEPPAEPETPEPGIPGLEVPEAEPGEGP
ncbi:MAG: PorV/PorQ family protein [Candidatus Coatesbacteria bacterium]|nr:MAG: PorV/PorQ family protein [Candidatus Coatesbacteria bacterium]